MSDPLFHNRRFGVDLTAVSPVPPCPSSSLENPLFCDRLLTRTLRRHDGSVGARPSRSGQCGLWCRPVGFSAAEAWKVASPIHMGIMHSRYEGSLSSPRPAG